MSFVLFKNKLECAVDGAPSQVSTLVAVVANSMAEGGTGLLSHTLTMSGGHVASLEEIA